MIHLNISLFFILIAPQTKHDCLDHNICSIFWIDFTFKSCRTSCFSLKWIKGLVGWVCIITIFVTVKNYHMNQFLLFELRICTYLQTSILIWNSTSINTLYLSVWVSTITKICYTEWYIFYLFYISFFQFSVWSVYFHTVRFPTDYKHLINEPNQNNSFLLKTWGKAGELSTQGIKWCSRVDKDKTQL